MGRWCPQICLLFLIKINWGLPFSWLEIKCDFKVFRALWHQEVFLGLDYKLLTYESSDQLVVTFIFLGTFMMVALLYNNKTAYTKRTVQFRKTCLKIQFYVGGVEIIPRFFFGPSLVKENDFIIVLCQIFPLCEKWRGEDENLKHTSRVIFNMSKEIQMMWRRWFKS